MGFDATRIDADRDFDRDGVAVHAGHRRLRQPVGVDCRGAGDPALDRLAHDVGGREAGQRREGRVGGHDAAGAGDDHAIHIALQHLVQPPFRFCAGLRVEDIGRQTRAEHQHTDAGDGERHDHRGIVRSRLTRFGCEGDDCQRGHAGEVQHHDGANHQRCREPAPGKPPVREGSIEGRGAEQNDARDRNHDIVR